jgi:hypothetical protein
MAFPLTSAFKLRPELTIRSVSLNADQLAEASELVRVSTNTDFPVGSRENTQ